MKTFDTVPARNTVGKNSEGINWHDGGLINRTSNIWMHYGNKKEWTRDVNWTVSHLGGRLHNSQSYSIGGDNGREHYANYEQNISGWGRYIPMKFVQGFSIDFKQDSTAGHGLFLMNAGIEFEKEDGTILRWGSNDRSRQGDYETHTVEYKFGSEQSAMAAGNARFHRFICRLSTKGGSGSRLTNVKLGNFRLLWDNTGSNNGRWIVPGLRRVTDMHSPDINTL